MSDATKTAIFMVGVKAVIMRGSQLLMLHMSDVPKWELPGGRIDEGETDLAQTLTRELQEELPGISQVSIGDIVYAQQTDFMPKPGYHLLLVYVRAKATLPVKLQVSHEHTDARWVTASELETLPMNPTVRQVVKQIFSRLQTQ
jgi:8-oxo-dGTP pyrophosphatase MutT (NUDIX family)